MVVRNDIDRLIYEREIGPYLPSRIFDAHTHLMQRRFHPGFALAPGVPTDNVDMQVMRSWWENLFPDAAVNGLVMGYPSKGMELAGENEFVASEVNDGCDRLTGRPEWESKGPWYESYYTSIRSEPNGPYSGSRFQNHNNPVAKTQHHPE